MYDGINKLLPYAKGLSAKITGFDENGDDLDIDYPKMLDVVRKSNYNGYIGIEYRGSTSQIIFAFQLRFRI